MSKVTEKLALYLRTVRWLRVSQLGWFIYRRLRPSVNPPAILVEATRELHGLCGWAASPEPEQRELRFLNVSYPADPSKLQWHPEDYSRLWRYNLHYFDYLGWKVIPVEFKDAYLDSWINANPPGTADAWEPYTLSLRVVNWIKYFAETDREISEAWSSSLINQANWLCSNLELHILANHLFKNVKALVFAGVWFKGAAGQRMLKKGLELLDREVREQMLPDGGHYERTPMYHSIVLEDCLDTINLLQSANDINAERELAVLKEKALRALAFLEDICGGDDQIPLFNDSARGIAPSPDELLNYGERLLGYKRFPVTGRPRQISRKDSGIFGYRLGNDSLLIDCGRIGPNYQPGHTHCDMLSFELCLDGRRLIVDPGVHGYEGDSTRHYLRSTAGHNTVCVNGVEQSEIWGTFRVARRAKPLSPSLEVMRDGRIQFTGSHDGYSRLREKVIHERSIEVDCSGKWIIIDKLTGEGEIQAESFVHFASDVRLVGKADCVWDIYRAEALIGVIKTNDGIHAELQESYVCPEFGRRESAPVLVLNRTGQLPLRLGYTLLRPEQANIALT